jgi:hypothetical protein
MREKFNFSESSNSFIGVVELQNKSIEVQINLEESQLDWSEIENFIFSLEDKKFNDIEETSQKLLLEFIKLVPFGVSPPFNKYEFRLEAVSYYGKINNLIFSDMVDGVDLIFKLYQTGYEECDDPYGNYIVKVENRLITGVHREQV